MKRFVDEFNAKKKEVVIEISDYNAFPNKVLLDNLRNKIIQNLIDGNIENFKSMNDYVRNEIDKTLEKIIKTDNVVCNMVSFQHGFYPGQKFL